MSNTLLNFPVIAIDGPAASGKSTVGRLLAEKLNFLMLDTGFMYRAVTLAALRAGMDLTDETAVTTLSAQLDLDVQPAGGMDDGRHYTALLNGEDVTWDLRTPEVDANVSLVSSYAGVRQEMVKRQRAFGQRGQVVMVGRDIGTVVMPDAPLKLYITASAAERARRRWRDRQQQGHDARQRQLGFLFLLFGHRDDPSSGKLRQRRLCLTARARHLLHVKNSDRLVLGNKTVNGENEEMVVTR